MQRLYKLPIVEFKFYVLLAARTVPIGILRASALSESPALGNDAFSNLWSEYDLGILISCGSLRDQCQHFCRKGSSPNKNGMPHYQTADTSSQSNTLRLAFAGMFLSRQQSRKQA